jgi:hypothetical protein
VTNGERADRLLSEARQITGEMHRALDGQAWNLATRRAQEVLDQETIVASAQARDWVERVDRALQFGEALLGRLRKAP